MNKKIATTLYAKALVEVLSKKGIDEKAVVKNFIKLLITNNHESLSADILTLAENMLLAKQGARKITIETARKMKPSQSKMVEKIIKKGDLVQEKINPSMIAGIKITVNDQMQFDNSLLGKLNNI